MIIRCDGASYLSWFQEISPKFKAWSFNFGSVPAYADSYTDVVDLGENYRYTLLIAKKIGNMSSNSYIEIQTSVDGSRWAPAASANYSSNIAKYSANSEVFCAHGRPIGRYVRVYHHNGSSNQNELVIELVASFGI